MDSLTLSPEYTKSKKAGTIKASQIRAAAAAAAVALDMPTSPSIVTAHMDEEPSGPPVAPETNNVTARARNSNTFSYSSSSSTTSAASSASSTPAHSHGTPTGISRPPSWYVPQDVAGDGKAQKHPWGKLANGSIHVAPSSSPSSTPSGSPSHSASTHTLQPYNYSAAASPTNEQQQQQQHQYYEARIADLEAEIGRLSTAKRVVSGAATLLAYRRGGGKGIGGGLGAGEKLTGRPRRPSRAEDELLHVLMLLDEKEDELASARHDAHALRDDVQLLLDELQMLREEKGACEDRIGELEVIKDAQADRLAAVDARIQYAKDQVADAASEVSAEEAGMAATLLALKEAHAREVAEVEEKRRKAEVDAEILRGQVHKQEEIIAALNADVARLQSEADVVPSLLHSQREKHAAHELAVAELEEKNAKAQEVSTSLFSKLTEVLADLEEKEATITDLNDLVERLQAETDAIPSIIDSHKEQHAAVLHTHKSVHESTVSDLVGQLAALREALAGEEEASEQYKKEAEELAALLAKEKEERAEEKEAARVAAEFAAAEIVDLTTSLKELQERFHGVVALNEDLHELVNDPEKSPVLITFRQKAQAALSFLGSLRSDLTSLRRELVLQVRDLHLYSGNVVNDCMRVTVQAIDQVYDLNDTAFGWAEEAARLQEECVEEQDKNVSLRTLVVAERAEALRNSSQIVGIATTIRRNAEDIRADLRVLRRDTAKTLKNAQTEICADLALALHAMVAAATKSSSRGPLVIGATSAAMIGDLTAGGAGAGGGGDGESTAPATPMVAKAVAANSPSSSRMSLTLSSSPSTEDADARLRATEAALLEAKADADRAYQRAHLNLSVSDMYVASLQAERETLAKEVAILRGDLDKLSSRVQGGGAAAGGKKGSGRATGGASGVRRWNASFSSTDQDGWEVDGDGAEDNSGSSGLEDDGPLFTHGSYSAALARSVNEGSRGAPPPPPNRRGLRTSPSNANVLAAFQEVVANAMGNERSSSGITPLPRGRSAVASPDGTSARGASVASTSSSAAREGRRRDMEGAAGGDPFIVISPPKSSGKRR